MQQNGSFTHTLEAQALHPIDRAAPEAHSLWAQLPAQGTLQKVVTSLTQALSQPPEQQNGSLAQTCVTHGSHPTVRAPPETHLSWRQPPQGPQSPGQLWQVSPASHAPLPQLGGHAPQSAGQLWQVSFGPWHCPLPHTGPQMPQSPGQVAQVSPLSHAPLPQLGGH